MDIRPRLERRSTGATQLDRDQLFETNRRQLGLTFQDNSAATEDPSFLRDQLITCIGNKRGLLKHIAGAVERVKARVGKDRLRILDAFAGSGVVSRFFKAHATLLVSNDIEDFAVAAARCYLTNRTAINIEELQESLRFLNDKVDEIDLPVGFIEELYAPRDENHITKRDRVFYTRRNARRLDNYRRLLAGLPQQCFDLLLGPVLSEASVHANTAGVFKGFYKDRRTKIGRFGGTNGDALVRIMGEITLRAPVLSRCECDVQILQDDANHVVRKLGGLDLAYFDPPYNQHPYGSNYFMLNLLVTYKKPTHISRVSGIPPDWKRSDYNVRHKALNRLRDLVNHTDAKFILVSFNNEGFVRRDEIMKILDEVGSVEVVETPYNTFRGSRNLRNRSIHVTEQLFLVERR